MNYIEMKETQRTELNNFPICFAFSNEQLKEGLAKLNATKEEVLSIGGGGFIRKTDKKEFLDLFARQETAMETAMEDDTFLISAIIYELGNHEFCITYDPADTVDCLSLDMDNERISGCFKTARREYLDSCEGY